MSDSYYDALRAAGKYPPKGWGWKSEDNQRQEVRDRLARGNPEPWVRDEARRLGISVA